MPAVVYEHEDGRIEVLVPEANDLVEKPELVLATNPVATSAPVVEQKPFVCESPVTLKPTE